jgi:CheY-like chemotaxis protein
MDEEPRGAAAGAADPAAASRAAVLIVDDHPDVRESLAEVLLECGIEAATAANGERALAHLRSAPPPRLVLLDLMMPGMSGWEMLAEMRQDPGLAGVPVVVLSGVADVHRQAGQLKVDGYLRKPIETALFVEIVKSYCQ